MMMKPDWTKRYLGCLLPLGALAGGAACANAFSRNIENVYRGSLAYSPQSQATHFRGEERYGESWTFLVKDLERDLHVMMTMAVCNPSDTSYLSETTAAYLSFACCHRGSGWQLLDRYPLHQINASDEHGEVRLGPFQDPRCFFKETTREGITAVEAAGELERETFLSNGYPGPLKDISWNFRFHFRGCWYPDAWISQLRGVGRYLKPVGVSISCRAADVSGGLKVNDSFFDFSPERQGSHRAFLLHRWDHQPEAAGPSFTCIAEGGDGPSAFLACRFQEELETVHPCMADPFSLLFYMHDGSTAAVLRNNPLRHGLVRAETSAGDRSEAGDRLPRVAVRGRGRRGGLHAEAIPGGGGALSLVFPSPGGQCIRQLWCPSSRLVLLREAARGRLRDSSVSGSGLDLPADIILERASGDWWDQVADMIEIPIDLNTF